MEGTDDPKIRTQVGQSLEGESGTKTRRPASEFPTPINIHIHIHIHMIEIEPDPSSNPLKPQASRSLKIRSSWQSSCPLNIIINNHYTRQPPLSSCASESHQC